MVLGLFLLDPCILPTHFIHCGDRALPTHLCSFPSAPRGETSTAGCIFLLQPPAYTTNQRPPPLLSLPPFYHLEHLAVRLSSGRFNRVSCDLQPATCILQSAAQSCVQRETWTSAEVTRLASPRLFLL